MNKKPNGEEEICFSTSKSKEEKQQQNTTTTSFTSKGKIFSLCCLGDLKMVKEALSSSSSGPEKQSKSSMQVFNRFGFTPLHSACFFGRLEIVRWIAQENLCDLNVLSRGEGVFAPPIHYAICNGHREIVSLLLKYGADPFICDYRGYNALALARLHGNKKMIKIIGDFVQEKNARYSDAVMVAKSASLNPVDGNLMMMLKMMEGSGHSQASASLNNAGGGSVRSLEEFVTMANGKQMK